MHVAVSEQFFRDFQGLASPIAKKTQDLLIELQRADPAQLRQNALPGWRLHALRGSSTVTLSVDMNFRAIARLDGGSIVLLRVVKHDTADRAHVNRNDGAQPLAELSETTVGPEEVYGILRSFGISDAEAEPFRQCVTEDDLLAAASNVSERTANLALTVFETSGFVVPRCRFRVLHPDDLYARALDAGGGEWELFLHPSQAYLVGLPAPFRAAVVGSAGTGKTVCAWHRTAELIRAGARVGFCCPHESVLEVSKDRLLKMAGDGRAESYYLVPRSADELLQLSAAVDHLVFDEAQELPPSWLATLGERLKAEVGVTLFYDVNQLGGNIENGDLARYRKRISEWRLMLDRFPGLHRFALSVNYRNAREIAAYYTTLLADALPEKPVADVPTFETGEVVRVPVRPENLLDALAITVHRLLQEHAAPEIGVITLGSKGDVRRGLADRGVPVADPGERGVVVDSPSRFRGHERQVIIVVSTNPEALRRKFGYAIDGYIAMSRAVKRLFVIEVAK